MYFYKAYLILSLLPVLPLGHRLGAFSRMVWDGDGPYYMKQLKTIVLISVSGHFIFKHL